jgi:hypothetical protein
MHMFLAPDKIKETTYLGYGYMALALASWYAIYAIWHVKRSGWAVAALASLGTVTGFIATRTVGLPGARGDIGNWSEPAGAVALGLNTVIAVWAGIVAARWVEPDLTLD